MSSVTEPTNAKATRLAPIFDASLSEQVAEHGGRPVLIVPPPR